jgi:hypothetical protein
MGLHLPAENLMETNIDTCVALTVIFLSIIGFVLGVKKPVYWRYRTLQNTRLHSQKRENRYELFCDRQCAGPVERNCRKRWYLESKPRLQINSITPQSNKWMSILG